MNSQGKEQKHLIDIVERNLALDKVLKPRNTGKRMPEKCSSGSQNENQSDIIQKNKPISKEKNEPTILITQVSSTDIALKLVFNETLSLNQIQGLLIRLKNIRSLKYDKLSQKIRCSLVQTIFKNNYQKFINIVQAYTPSVGSIYLLHSIFHGFQLAWTRQKFDSIEYFLDFLKLYIEKIPNCLYKKFAKWMKERAQISLNRSIYPSLKKKVLSYVNEVIQKNSIKKHKTSDNQKIIALVVFFDLFSHINVNQFMKIVPPQKINQYIDNDQLNKINSKPQQQQQEVIIQKMQEEKNTSIEKYSQDSQVDIKASPLVHYSILELIAKNNLKEVQKILRSFKIPHTNYPQFVQKLQMKYLEYVQRSNPLYVVDQLVHGKINLVQGLINIYLKRKKYDHVDHFVNKYKLRGVKESNKTKIFINPLKDQDSFGPTESHVLNQRPQTYFLRLLDFDVLKSNVIWIDSQTIYQKAYTVHLKKLLFSKEVGLDSESLSAIHVFEKAKLQIIQIYEPQTNVVILFDVKDFKNDKKKRVKKNITNQNQIKKTNLLKQASQLNRLQIALAIDLEENQRISQKEQQNVQKTTQKQHVISPQINKEEQDSSQLQKKAWYRFTKVIQNIFKNSTIYGHALHSDIGDIISELNLNLKFNQLKIKDSQSEFKKNFPQQTKSSLSFLAEKCFGKEISKFEQCSAWDKRPLRNAQKHYAALDAVLPLKLVKWMEQNRNKTSS